MFSNEGNWKKDDNTRAEPRSSNALTNLSGRTGTQPQAPLQPEPKNSVPGSQDRGGSKLVVGPNIKMKGVEVTDCDTLIVEGHIEATLDSRLVQVTENGVFTGNASMDVAEIWGRLEGEFTVRQQLIIHPSGRVNGHVRYRKIRVEEGGEISGEISTLSGAPASESAVRTPETKSVKSVPAVSKENSRATAST